MGNGGTCKANKGGVVMGLEISDYHDDELLKSL